MKLSMSMCKQIRPVTGLDLPLQRYQPEKVVVVMGATGTGKSRLSIDLATWFPAEIVNSDKMQVYQGLDIITNKITDDESLGIPHHLIGVADPNTDFTAADFSAMASASMQSILSRGKVPIITGGSTSFIEKLVEDKELQHKSNPNLHYEFCFLWVDVSMPILGSFLSKRADRMLKQGMVDEARSMFKQSGDYSRGIRRAIGVPEFHHYFCSESFSGDVKSQDGLLEEAVEIIKINNCKLACRQREKICRLKSVRGWKVHRVDATDVFRKSGGEADEAWEELVVRPSAAIVSRFLYNFQRGSWACLTEMSALSAAATS